MTNSGKRGAAQMKQITDTGSISTRACVRAAPQRKARKAAPTPKPAFDGKRDARGRFGVGNAFWRARASSGPAPMFANGEALWAACVEYFEWVDNNPLREYQIITYQGVARQVAVRKMRAMSKRDLCLFLGIARTTWAAWKDHRPDLAEAIEKVETVVWVWKFEGAAAGLLNANIIARELGLGDKQR